MAWIDNILFRFFAPNNTETQTVKWKEQYTLPNRAYELTSRAKDLRAFAKNAIELEKWFVDAYQARALDTPQSQGLYLQTIYNTDFNFFELFVLYIIQALKTERKLYLNPIREIEFEEGEEFKKETVFVYLKPKIESLTEHQMHQRFGQISLHLTKQKENYSLKIQCNYYAGYQYAKPQNFKELLSFLSQAGA